MACHIRICHFRYDNSFIGAFWTCQITGYHVGFWQKGVANIQFYFSLCVYIIAVALPVPRTAAVTHEMAILPYLGTDALLTSSVYFALVFIFVMNRNNIIEILGKYLTPGIVIILLAIIGIGLFAPSTGMNPSVVEAPVVSGLLEGYQTYDALAGLLTGGIVVISVHNYKTNMSFEQKKRFIARSALVAMIGLFIVYAGLIWIGAKYNTQFPEGISRIELLTGLSENTLGNVGTSFLSVLVALACFTTAIGVIVGTADFFSGLFNNSRRIYLYTAIVCCFIGIAIGQMDVKYIIEVALPALMFIYPLCVVLILLNMIPEKYASKAVFRMVVLITFLFSIPDFLSFLIPFEGLEGIKNMIPFANLNMGWVLPAIIIFLLVNIPRFVEKNSDTCPPLKPVKLNLTDLNVPDLQ